MDEKLLGAAASCAATDFESRINQTFQVATLTEPDHWFELKLTHVSQRKESGEGLRTQFSVFFEFVESNQLEQGQLCTIRENDQDWLVLFLSPIANPDLREGQPKIIVEAAFC